MKKKNEPPRYGIFLEAGRGSKVLLAHRYSYELHKGPIPDGRYVMHTCDVTNCVYPDHLVLGSQQDNVDDMMQKGRNGKTGPKIGTGAKNKLTPDQIIWARDYSEHLTHKEAGQRLGVGASTIARIRKGKSCQNINGG